MVLKYIGTVFLNLYLATTILATPLTTPVLSLINASLTYACNKSEYHPYDVRVVNNSEVETAGDLHGFTRDTCCEGQDTNHSRGSEQSCCFPPSTDNLFGVFFAIGSIFSVTGNFLAIAVWSTYLNNYLTILYLNLSVCDFIISVSGTTVVAQNLFKNRAANDTLMQFYSFCMFQGLTYELCSLVSGSIVSILGIARWYSFARPFNKMRKDIVYKVLAVSWIYHAIPHVGFTLSYLTKLADTRYVYHPQIATCALSIVGKLPPWFENMAIVFFAILPTLINSIIIPITCLKVIHEICKQQRQHLYYSIYNKKATKKSGKLSGSAITVAVIALVFLGCALPLWVWQYIDIVDAVFGTQFKVSRPKRVKHNLDFVFYTVLTNLNAAINPYLYYVRGVQFRQLLFQKVSSLAGYVRCIANAKETLPQKTSNSSLGPQDAVAKELVPIVREPA